MLNYMIMLFCLFSVSLAKHFLWPFDFTWLSTYQSSGSVFQQWPASTHGLFTFYLNKLPLTSVANFPLWPPARLLGQNPGGSCPNASQPWARTQWKCYAPLSLVSSHHKTWKLEAHMGFALWGKAFFFTRLSALFQALLVLMLFPISRFIYDWNLSVERSPPSLSSTHGKRSI